MGHSWQRLSHTWRTDVTAASVELLAGAVTLLLLPAGQRVDVHGPRRQVLDHHPLVGAVVLVGSVDAARVPVRPVDVLAVHGHGERVYRRAHNDLPVGPGERAALNLLSDVQSMVMEINKTKNPECEIILPGTIERILPISTRTVGPD